MANKVKFVTLQIEAVAAEAAKVEQQLEAAAELLNVHANSMTDQIRGEVSDSAPAARLIAGLLEAHIAGEFLPWKVRDLHQRFKTDFYNAGLCGGCGQTKKSHKHEASEAARPRKVA